MGWDGEEKTREVLEIGLALQFRFDPLWPTKSTVNQTDSTSA
jgi:hypothetical protein